MNALPTDPERWHRISAILDLVLDYPPEKRNVFLVEACAGDENLRAEVEAFLTADAEASAFLDTPAGEYVPELLAEAAGDEESEKTDLAGHHVGRYRLLREVGGGGMGTVYEAEDTQLGRRVAVKILPPEYSRDRRAKERFLREARAAAAVDHPNLCTVHDAGESEGRLYIVLSFYEGETLRDRIRRGPLPIAEAREIAIQVARGLARAHEAGIVHRDIKPANVMLPRRGEAKILDFGIARLQGDEVSLTRTGASWGTPAYMSPEQARGEPVDARADVWSLGVMLYEMIAGRRPFGGDSIEALVSSILTQEPPPLEWLCPEVPPGLARVVDRALAKDREERYASVTELLADLESGKARGRRLLRTKVLRMIFLPGALTVFVLLIFALWRWQSAPGPPVRVAVLRPVVKSVSNDPDLAFVASEVVDAALVKLVSLEGLQALDPPDRDEKSGSEAERLRAIDADEVLISRLDCSNDSCRVRFRRQKPGGEVLATIAPFEVHTAVENARQLAEAVQVNLEQAYPDRPIRPGLLDGKVRLEDYSTYIKIQRKVDKGELVGDEELGQLDDLLRTSPGLVGAYELAAGIARNQRDLDRAFAYAVKAEKIAPYDPRPLFTKFRIEVKQNQLDAAGVTLDRLAALAPADIRVMRAEAELLEAQGELEKAGHLRQQVVQRRPTWRHILELANLELSLGAPENAQRRLTDLLKVQPNNHYVLESLAMLEVTSGDLEHAARLYERLVPIQPTLPNLTNLGFVRYLLGDYSGAAEAYRQALHLDPGHLQTRFNLATSLEAQGKLNEAQALFFAVEKELAAASSFDVQTRMLHAQCLARLGRRGDAARLADEVLKQRPEDVHVLHQAAQLYAFLGDRYSALFYTKLALEKGLRREWFTIPGFRPLAGDQEFQALLDSSPVTITKF